MGGGGAGELPVTLFAGEIVAQVREHPVVVIIGETGSGKTTQISQILYRAHFAQTGTIAITQPRRVAAVTVARSAAFLISHYYFFFLTPFPFIHFLFISVASVRVCTSQLTKYVLHIVSALPSQCPIFNDKGETFLLC